MRQNNMSFACDPKGYADRIALRPSCQGAADLARIDTSAMDPDFQLYKVEGENRIFYADLEADGRRGAVENSTLVTGAEQNRVDIVKPCHEAEGMLPIYWLPWIPNGITRITLTPPKKKSAQLVGKNYGAITHPLEEPAAGLIHPNFFFTAELDGCQVYAEGKADCPTVCHINSMDTARREFSRRQNFDFTQRQMDLMARRQNIFFPKGANSLASMKSSRLEQYLRPEVDPGRKATVVRNAKLPEYWPRLKDELMGSLADTRVPQDQDDRITAKTYGTVFGWRKPGQNCWQFYWQKRMMVDYPIYPIDHGGTGWAARRDVAVACHKFWP